MLDFHSTAISLFSLIVLSFPTGFLVMDRFQSKRISSLPFFTLLPLYLAIGISVQFLVSFLVGTVLISPLIPILTSAFSIIIILIWKYAVRNSRHKPMLASDRIGNFFSLIILVLLFVYFARIPIDTSWPPAGDAITHSALTSLTIYKGHIPMDFEPIYQTKFPYPLGYHIFSANFSYLINLNPGETVFVIATFLITLLAALLFTLAYVLTKSYWLSLPIPFSILIVHSSHNLERWIGGYIFNGPFPNIFGFMVLIAIITLAQMSYNNKQRLSRISPLLTCLLLSLFITYPNFVFHAVLFIAVYAILQVNKLNFIYPASINISNHHQSGILNRHIKGHGVKRSDLGSTTNSFMEHTMNYEKDSPNVPAKFRRRRNFLELKISFLILAVFIIGSFLAGLIQFYYDILTFNLGEFKKHENSSYLDTNTVLTNFRSDYFYAALLASGIVATFAVMIIKKKLVPIFIGSVLLLLAISINFNFIYPQRTLTLVATLSWIFIAYDISEIAVSARKRRMIAYAFIFGFTITALSFEIPHIAYLLGNDPGWFLTKTDNFYNTYGAGIWLKQNAKPNDLILNDRSYSSLFIDGFSIHKLAYSYWGGYAQPMPQELSFIWSNPTNRDNVYSLLKKYDVKYIILTAEGGYIDYEGWGGSGKYVQKSYTNQQYQKIFESYEFLKLEYKNGNAFVYSVQ